MAGARCDSGRLSKPVWTASCGPRPPVGSIAASACVTKRLTERSGLCGPHLPPVPTGRPRPGRCGRSSTQSSTCCDRLAWRLFPTDSAAATVYAGSAAALRGVLERLNHHLVMADRERDQTHAEPLPHHRQSERQDDGCWRALVAMMPARRSTAESVMRSSTLTGVGLRRQPTRLASKIVMAPEPVLSCLAALLPLYRKVFADSGYAGEAGSSATSIAVEIVRAEPNQVGFAVLPRRWVVERFFAWIGRNRRLAKDFEATIASARAFLYAASIMLLVRRLAQSG